MGVFGRLSEAEGVIAFIDRTVKWAPAVLGLGGFSWAGAWATHAVNAFEQYSPFSWVFGGFIGALIFATIYWLWAAARQHIAKAEYVRQRFAAKDAVNPLEAVFTKQTIDLNAFRGPLNDAVVGKTFIGCDLDGPAVIGFLGNVLIEGVQFGECDFVVISQNAKPHNAIAFVNPTIRGGRIRRVTILVQPRTKEALQGGMKGAITWLTDA